MKVNVGERVICMKQTLIKELSSEILQPGEVLEVTEENVDIINLPHNNIFFWKIGKKTKNIIILEYKS